jgi:SAM-dependent methyltransferase
MQGWLCPICFAVLSATPETHHCHRCEWARRRLGRLWLADEDIAPEGFDLAAVVRLRLMETHFWMRERRHLIERLLRDDLAPASQYAVELGCGTGKLLPLLEHRFSNVIAVDAHAILLEQAAENSSRAELFQADICRTTLPTGIFSLVMAMDVIEHVDPDAFLTEARRLIAPGGMLLMSAPASPLLWSHMDEMAGHRCRYTRKLMENELRRNGWIPVGHTHYQCLLFPLVWLSCLLGTRSHKKVERKPPAWLDRLLGNINHIETTLFSGLSLPFGSSLFMWARAE